MEQKKTKTLQQIIRALHRDIGFFMIGITVIFTLSGTVLIFRDTELLKAVSTEVRELKPGMAPNQLGEMLRLKEFKVIKEDGDIIDFQVGTYNKTTGVAVITMKTYLFPLNKFTDLHKTYSKKATHYFMIVFGFLLCFLAISSFWMYKPNNKNFKRGLILATSGIVTVILLLVIA